MSNDPIINTMIETIQLFLQESQNVDDNTRCALILQTEQFYKNIMETINENSSALPDLLKCLRLLFDNVTPNLNIFLSNKEHAISLSSLLLYIINSYAAPHIAREFSVFTLSFIFAEKYFDETSKLFFPVFKIFFAFPDFVGAFESTGGVHALWELLKNPIKKDLCEAVFSELYQTISRYFRSNQLEDSLSFLTNVISSFQDIPKENSLRAFQFICDLISNSQQGLIINFINDNGFKTFNNYILKYEDPNLLVVYQMFCPLCTDIKSTTANSGNPVICELLNLLEIKTLPQTLRLNGLKHLHQLLKQFSRDSCPFRPQSLYILASLTNSGQEEAVALLFKISSFLISQFKFDITTALPAFLKLCTYKIATDVDMTSLFETIKIVGSSFDPFVPSFFNLLTYQISNEEFFGLINKYPVLLELLNTYFQIPLFEGQFASLFYNLSPKLVDKQTYSNIFAKLIINEKSINNLLKFIGEQDEELSNALLKDIADSVIFSPRHRSFINSIGIFSQLNLEKVNPILIFDLIVGLSGQFFSIDNDKYIANFLSEHKYFNMPSESIQKMAFGVFQNDSMSAAHLIFPSLLPYCGSFEISSPFDMWICGQYGIDHWLKETGKTIDQFPSIAEVAKRFLLPKHVQLLFDYPKLFSECCKDTFGMISLFEFAKSLINTKITAKVVDDMCRSVSFWFTVKAFPPAKMLIAKTNGVSLSISCDSLFVGDVQLCDITINRWYHIAMSMTERPNICSVYFNGNLIAQVEFVSLKNIVEFGDAQFNPIQWFIGGSIRIYSQTIDHNKIQHLYLNGVSYIVKSEKPVESVIINAQTFVELFGGFKMSTNLSENSRPVISFPLLHHLSHAYKGGTCILNLILKQLQKDDVDINNMDENLENLLSALCNIQKLQLSGWSNSVFAVRMSAIFYLRPSIFSTNTLTDVLSCFTSDVKDAIQWDPILSFLLDYGLFNSSNRQFLISKLFEYIAQFSIDDYVAHRLSKFIFHVLNLSNDLEDSEFDALISLLYKIRPKSFRLAEIIMSSCDFKENVMNPSLIYQCNFDDKIYKSLFELFLSGVDECFTEYPMVFILPQEDAFKLLKKIIISQNHRMTLNNRILLIHYCLGYVEVKEIWPIVINLICFSKTNNTKADANKLFSENLEILNENGKMDSEFIAVYMIFLSFLSIIVLNNKDDTFWNELWNKIYAYVVSFIPLFTLEMVTSKRMIANFIQLLSFGLNTRIKVRFPFCPSLDSPDEVSQISLIPGHPFPDEPGTTGLRPNAAFKYKSAGEVHKAVSNLIPEKYYLIPPNSARFIRSHKKLYTQEFVNQVMSLNKSKIQPNWHNFLPTRHFTVEDVENSIYFKDIISFVAKLSTYLLGPIAFSSNVNNLADNENENENDNDSDDSSSTTTYGTNDSQQSEIGSPSPPLFSMISDAISSTLSSSSVTLAAPINPTSMNAGANINSSSSVNNVSIKENHTGMFNQFFLNIFMNQELIDTKFSLIIVREYITEILSQLILKRIYYNFIVITVSRRITTGWFESRMYLPLMVQLFTLTQKCKHPLSRHLLDLLVFGFDNIPADFFHDFLNIFITFSDVIFKKENFINSELFTILLFDKLCLIKKDHNDQVNTICMIFYDSLRQILEPTSTIATISQCLIDLAESTFVMTDNISIFIKDQKDKYDQSNRKNIFESLSRDANRRDNQTTYFYISVNEILGAYNEYAVFSKSIASIVRHFDQRMLLFNANYFLRQREKLLTTRQFFEMTITETNTISLFNDPIYPSRRVEKSPMIYQLPPFPTTSEVKSILPQLPDLSQKLSLLPDVLLDQLSLDYQSVEILMLHSAKQLNLAFCFHYEIDDALLLATLVCIIDKENETKVFKEVSILYGIAPLDGVLFVTEKYFFFVEGLKKTNNGVRFTHSNMNEIIYEFYISYITAGYFGQSFMFHGHPILQFRLNHINSVIPHIWLQKETAFEINFVFGWTFILIVKNLSDYDYMNKFLNETMESNLQRFPPLTKCLSPINNARILRMSIRDINKLWTEGQLTNNAYLLILNKLSGRSFIDLSQFCVFPWTISDFQTKDLENIPIESFRDLSLPMGQIGFERRPRFDLFFEASKYYYGTHYMHLGVVLFYLFRLDPFNLFSIYFHHGWDNPNRIFNDMTDAYYSAAVVSQNDVKEIVPQLFSCPEYLVNTSNLPLTETAEGKSVADVKLAGWSKNPRNFTEIMRYELESEKVSKKLNNWIDLIFGFKSRGEPAIEAKNVFPPLCYVQKEEDQTIATDEVARDAAVASIINFGQCPRQIFKSPHSQKVKFDKKLHLMSDPSLLIHQSLKSKEFIWPINDIQTNDENINTASINSMILFNTTITYSTEKAAMLKMPQSTVLFECLTSVDFFILSADGSLAALFQKEGSFNVYFLKYEKSEVKVGTIVMRFQTLSNVTDAVISTAHFLIIAACGSIVERFDIGLVKEVGLFDVGFVIRKVAVDDHAALIIVCGDDTIAIYSISGQFVIKKSIDSAVSTVVVANLEENVGNRFFITGHENGYIRFWAIDYANEDVVCLKSSRITEKGITKIAISDDALRAVAVSKGKEIFCFDFYGSSAPNLRREFAVECSNCSKKLVEKPKVCSNCHRFFCAECIPLVDNPIGHINLQAPKFWYICQHCQSIKKYKAEDGNA